MVARDLAYLHAVLVLRYEDLVRDPEAYRRALFAFMQLPDTDAGEPIRDGNTDYAIPPGGASDLAPRLASWGYAPGGETRAFTPACKHPLRGVQTAVMNAIDNYSPAWSAPSSKRTES